MRTRDQFTDIEWWREVIRMHRLLRGPWPRTEADRRANLDAFLDSLGDDE